MSKVKIFTFVPKENANAVREAVAKVGAALKKLQKNELSLFVTVILQRVLLQL